MFYSQFKKIQARTKVKLVIATSIKDYLTPVLKVLSPWSRRKRKGTMPSWKKGISGCWT